MGKERRRLGVRDRWRWERWCETRCVTIRRSSPEKLGEFFCFPIGGGKKKKDPVARLVSLLSIPHSPPKRTSHGHTKSKKVVHVMRMVHLESRATVGGGDPK
jgi:hypothetical protein